MEQHGFLVLRSVFSSLCVCFLPFFPLFYPLIHLKAQEQRHEVAPLKSSPTCFWFSLLPHRQQQGRRKRSSHRPFSRENQQDETRKATPLHSPPPAAAATAKSSYGSLSEKPLDGRGPPPPLSRAETAAALRKNSCLGVSDAPQQQQQEEQQLCCFFGFEGPMRKALGLPFLSRRGPSADGRLLASLPAPPNIVSLPPPPHQRRSSKCRQLG